MKRCTCIQRPKLRQTGWSGTHAIWYCPVCKKEYYEDKEKIVSEKPFKWPTRNVMGNSGGR